jgi:hypothetical protein
VPGGNLDDTAAGEAALTGIKTFIEAVDPNHHHGACPIGSQASGRSHLADRARLARGTKSIDLTMFFTGKSLLKVKPLPETPTLIDILHGSAGARLAWASKFRLAATLNSPRHASNELRTSQKSLKIPQTTKGKVKRRRPLLSAETIFDCASIFSTTLSSRIPIFTTNIARQRTGVALQMKLRPRNPLPHRWLAHLRRWHRTAPTAEHFITYDGQAIASVKRHSRTPFSLPSLGQKSCRTRFGTPRRRS